MMSAGRWIAVGGALFGVGGALAITRLAYIWQNGGDFWDVLSILGVVATALGLVLMLVGWMMPKEESSSPSRQVAISLFLVTASRESEGCLRVKSNQVGPSRLMSRLGRMQLFM